tara:strand:+ start:97 stop:591 length:495 start_codon:yes stop_codon:yes gene_type:complete
MITPSIRIKVTDFLATDYEQEVFQELMKLKQQPDISGIGFPLYFWYDRENEAVDLNTLEPFIKYWKSTGEHATKLIIYPELFDTQNDFIWYDIRPRNCVEYLSKPTLSYLQYYRFAYVYDNPKTGILEGLKDFYEKYSFVNNNISSDTKKRKQKRNDDEDSNHR